MQKCGGNMRAGRYVALDRGDVMNDVEEESRRFWMLHEEPRNPRVLLHESAEGRMRVMLLARSLVRGRCVSLCNFL